MKHFEFTPSLGDYINSSSLVISHAGMLEFLCLLSHCAEVSSELIFAFLDPSAHHKIHQSCTGDKSYCRTSNFAVAPLFYRFQ